jgi:DNA-binding transcriptional MerR regulator
MNIATRSQRKLISAKDLSRATDVSYAAINNYTDMGLLDIVTKKNRVRLYDAETARERLGMVLRLVSEGYTLRVIVKLLREGA